MADRASVITLGLCEIQVGAASAAGTMPAQMAKIGKTYKDTCKMTQDADLDVFHDGCQCG